VQNKCKFGVREVSEERREIYRAGKVSKHIKIYFYLENWKLQIMPSRLHLCEKEEKSLRLYLCTRFLACCGWKVGESPVTLSVCRTGNREERPFLPGALTVFEI
jgi:hypothetical protein